MTDDPNDSNRRISGEDYRSTTDRRGPYSRNPSNTGVIGAIFGALAMVMVVFVVWQSYEGNDTIMNTSTTTNPAGITATPTIQP
jgi:hypothetical protein